MIDPTLTVSIARTSLGLGPLVLSGNNDTTLGIAGYVEPAIQARVTYAGESPWLHGSTAVASTWQQSILGFDVVPAASSEASMRTLLNELRDAVGQFTFLTTVTVNGDATVWRCDTGSIGSVTRTYADLLDANPIYPVTIPVYPLPVS